jgi:hypothetical protein
MIWQIARVERKHVNLAINVGIDVQCIGCSGKDGEGAGAYSSACFDSPPFWPLCFLLHRA